MGPEADKSVAPGISVEATRVVGGGNGVDRTLLQALRNTSISVLYQDTSLRYLWAENLPGTWTAHPLSGSSDREIFPGPAAERLLAAKGEALASGEQQRLELETVESERLRWFDVWIDLDRTSDGTARGVITTVVEITDQKRREQTLRTLLREVSHRSKNLLAIIQSIATQTGRHSGTIGDFLTRFRGRLQSLAASQDLVTSSNWRGADLHELVAGQVVRFCADPVRNIRLEGANPYLNPNAALHVGLALHELAVNSVSFGALSRPDGCITISAQMADPKEGTLELVWHEAASAQPDLSTNRRFGSVALERVVPASLNGRADLFANEEALIYRLTIPAGNFELD